MDENDGNEATLLAAGAMEKRPEKSGTNRRRLRLAAIDIGTNSIRCIVVEGDVRGDFRVLDDEKATVRLGEGLAASGRISEAAWQRARDGLLRMKKIADGLDVSAVEAVATSAVRQAANGEAFLAAMRRETGLQIALISGEEEAELALLSARRHFDLDHARYALLDIGGGSVEVVTTAGSHIEEIFSLDLGAVVLSERFVRSDPVSDDDFARLRRHVRATLGKALGEREPVASLIGSGGSVTSVAALVMAMRGESYDSVHGYEVLRSEVVHLLAMLRRRDLKARRALPGLSPERADIILAGVTVVDEMMRIFAANLLRVNSGGIREGLILRGLQRHGVLLEGAPPRDWRSAVNDFAASCHVEEGHARHVAKLSLQLFDALAAPFSLAASARRLLEAAALLHDVGYFISYSAHHKHSYHLIRHASLFGFTPRDMETVANIARYHRKALPKKKHENFTRLAADDQLLVRRLGGILRLADGLDRRRGGQVEQLLCHVDARRIALDLFGPGDLSVELYGGRSKSDLLEDAFGRRLHLEAVSGAAPQP